MPTSVQLKTVDIKDLTSGTLDGTGSFDVMMRVIALHLDQQFKAQRITGNEYADTYLKAMQLAVQAGVQFTLENTKTATELALIEAQTRAVEEDIILKQLQRVQLQGQIEMLQDQKALLHAQVEGEEAQVRLIDQKILTEKSQTDPQYVVAGSLVDSQTKVYQKQAAGLDRDAEQKAAEIYLKPVLTAIGVESNMVSNLAAHGVVDGNTKGVLGTLLRNAGITNIVM